MSASIKAYFQYARNMAAYNGLNSGMIAECTLCQPSMAFASQASILQRQVKVLCAKEMLTLVDATFDDIIKQMQQDKIYSMTLQNEVKGLGWQRKTMTEIYQEGEEEQKQCALRYVQTLQHVMKSKSHLWNEIKAGTYSKSSVQDPASFYSSEHVKHKYVSESEDEDKQKPKEKTKGKGKGKGDGKKSTKGAKSGGRKTSTS